MPDRLKDYARQVAEVRALQRRFFRGDKSVVEEVKGLERVLDKETAAILDERPSLFDREEAS